jgi:hypothetical protein
MAGLRPVGFGTIPHVRSVWIETFTGVPLMANRSASLSGSSVTSVLSTLSFLFAGTLLIGGGLFVASHSLSIRPSAELSPPEKIGPTFSAKPSVAAFASTSTDQPAVGEVRQPILIEPSAASAKTTAPPSPSTAVVAPVPDASVALTDPGVSDRQAAKPVRTGRGSAGCTQYRTYDPQSQTYRGFDGKIYPCVSSNRSQ